MEIQPDPQESKEGITSQDSESSLIEALSSRLSGRNLAIMAIIMCLGFFVASYAYGIWPFGTLLPAFPPMNSVSLDDLNIPVSPTPVPAGANISDYSAEGTVDCGKIVIKDFEIATDPNTPPGNGSTEISYDADSLRAKECFEQRFSRCMPAIIISSVEAYAIEYYSEVVGPNGNFCYLKSRFIKNPNPEWAGKEMLCSLDNTKELKTAALDTSHCSGELYDLIRPDKQE